MKVLRSIVFILGLLCCCCSKYVYGTDGVNNPINGAEVVISSPSFTFQRGLTDNNGKIKIKRTFLKIQRPDYIQVNKEGFLTAGLPFPNKWPFYVSMNPQK
jgi:hypothetical protein